MLRTALKWAVLNQNLMLISKITVSSLENLPLKYAHQTIRPTVHRSWKGLRKIVNLSLPRFRSELSKTFQGTSICHYFLYKFKLSNFDVNKLWMFLQIYFTVFTWCENVSNYQNIRSATHYLTPWVYFTVVSILGFIVI